LLRHLDSELRGCRAQHASQINEIFGTLSWRITRPLRAVRKILLRKQ
jgi:hypothetical protein